MNITREGTTHSKEIDIDEIKKLSEEEIKHMKYLKSKYRDRAKERREGTGELGLEEMINEEKDHMFPEDPATKEKQKGLDYQLLKQEIEKIKGECYSKAQEL